MSAENSTGLDPATPYAAAAATTDYEAYRVLSMLAVASLIFGIISTTTLLFPRLAFLPIIGILCGWRALVVLRRRPEEFTGRPLALLGILLSTVCFTVGVGTAAFVYLTEVPDGYTRIAWDALQPEDENSGPPIPESALALDGERVFIKGYMYPEETTGKVRRFVIVPDMGTCCFGGQPELTDMIEVTLEGDLRAQYSIRQQRLAGTFRVDGRKKPLSGLDGVYYQLQADYLR